MEVKWLGVVCGVEKEWVWLVGLREVGWVEKGWVY